MGRRFWSVALTVSLLVTLLPIGPSAAQAGEIQPGGVFVFGLTEPGSIDPVNLHESEGMQVGQALFDSLTAWDPLTPKVVPAAAASWSPNGDATVWTFNLVEGATFHNGAPVAAADFKYAWERICDPVNESDTAYHLSAVEGYDEMRDGSATELSGVVAVNPTTLRVTLAYPYADFDAVVAHPTLAPVPQAAVEAGDFGEMPIGNGPFMMSEPWTHDDCIVLEDYDDYHGVRPIINGIRFDIFPDADSACAALQAGRVDFAKIPQGGVAAAVSSYGESPDGYTANPGEQVLLGGELATYYLLMNNEDAVLSELLVRRALSFAIDRQAICDTVFEGTRSPATGIVPEGVFGFQADGFAYSHYDAAEAAALLTAAGYPGGAGLPTIELAFNAGAGHEPILEMVQDDFAAIGVQAELAGSADFGSYLGKLKSGEYQVGRLGWMADYPTMENFLYPLFKSDSDDNYSGFSSASVDAALDTARGTTDDAARVAAYRSIETEVGDAAVLVPLMYYRHTHVASDRVHEGVFSPMGLMDFVGVWLDPDPVDLPDGIFSIAGTNRYETAIQASKQAYPNGAETVVIATGENWPDALGGAALAGSVDGPLLLTQTGSLPAPVLSEIKRLKATNVYILGGTGAVSAAVHRTLDSNLPGFITRIAGTNRFATANAVADEVIRLAGADFSGDAFIATGENFPDALGASPLAASAGTPILLAQRDAGPYLPKAVTSAVILGGTGAVSAKTEAAVVSALGSAKVTRVGGANRYDTAAKIADHGVACGMRWDGVGIATGTAFPDALSGGAMLGSFDSVLLLTDPATLSAPAQARLVANKATIDTLFFIGGTSAVSQGARDKVAQVLK